MIAIIVSESTFILSALERGVQGEFEEIRKIRTLTLLRATEDWSDVVVIFDMAHAQRGIDELLAFGADKLTRCIVLIREAEDLQALTPLVGMVGAIILDSSSLEELAQAARMVRNGLHILPMQMMPMLMRPYMTERLARETVASLTQRESSVLSLITQGCSNKIIGRRLQISDSTVRVHVRSLLKKLGVQNRTQAALVVLERRAQRPHFMQVEHGLPSLSDAGRLRPAH